MNPMLRHMRAFVALAKTGNFTLAAQYLHVSQCALSGLVKELGQTLGMRAVDRGPRTIPPKRALSCSPLFSQIIDDLDGALTNIAGLFSFAWHAAGSTDQRASPSASLARTS
jgi:DNA-binding transcriptional LysR family regulator